MDGFVLRFELADSFDLDGCEVAVLAQMTALVRQIAKRVGAWQALVVQSLHCLSATTAHSRATKENAQYRVQQHRPFRLSHASRP